MQTDLTTEVMTLRRLFSGRYHFHLPWFQRAYAWSDVQAGRLLHDLIEAAQSRRPRYVLGSVFLACDALPRAALIDGHQRVITLTLIFAILRDLLPKGPERDALEGAIGNPQTSSAPVLMTPQPVVADFFGSYVQTPGTTRLEPAGDIMQLAAGHRNILFNRNDLRRQIEERLPTGPARTELVVYMLDQCPVVVMAVRDEDEAWEIVSTQEETGLAFHSSERAKATLVSAMPADQQESAGRLYERCQGLIGADSMTRLLSYIRLLRVRRRSTRPVEKDLMQRFSLDVEGLAFLQSEVVPRAELLAGIKQRRLFPAGPVNDRLEHLSWLDHWLWVPPLLHWLSKVPADDPSTAEFVGRLDRLSWVMKLAGMDPTDQELRFIRVLSDIDGGGPPDQMPQLAIERKLTGAMLANLRSRTFFAKRYSGIVLRRINWHIDRGSDAGPADGNRVTIEHVLPRRPPTGSEWWHSFSDPAELGEHVNRLGNLVLLSSKDNQAIGSGEWKSKRPVLAGSTFAIARQAAAAFESWTRQTITQRTELMIQELLTPWNIDTFESD